MGLFQRNIFDNDRPLYELSKPEQVTSSNIIDKTFLVVGLGNPGAKYQKNRHNVGFQIVDNYANENDFASWQTKKDLKSEISVGQIGSSKVILTKPSTFMNESGQAIRAIMDFYKLKPEDLLVIHDELDQPFGNIRTRKGGAPAGHNGIKSVIKHIGKDFFRVRVGISNSTASRVASEDFVLKNFSKSESDTLPEIYKTVSEVITTFVDSGFLIPETIKLES